MLAQTFLEQSRRRLGKDIRDFLPEAMQRLMLHHWPGNVRELENTIEKAVIMATQALITPDLITFTEPPADSQLKPLTEAKEEFERQYLKQVLDLAGGNITRAAQLAGRYRADFQTAQEVRPYTAPLREWTLSRVSG